MEQEVTEKTERKDKKRSIAFSVPSVFSCSNSSNRPANFLAMSLAKLHLAWIFLTFFFLGCSGNPQPKAVPVHGKVMGRGGKSVGSITVIFWPDDTRKNQGAGALCEADGSFYLECLPGNYKVTISPVRPKGATEPPPPQGPNSVVPALYQNELTTTLRVRVPEAGTDDVFLNLK